MVCFVREESCVPFTQPTVVHDELDALDWTGLLEFSADVILADVEEEISHVEGWAGRQRWPIRRVVATRAA